MEKYKEKCTLITKGKCKNVDLFLRQCKQVKELKQILKELLDCPRTIDEATVPKIVLDGEDTVEPYADQIVYNMSVSLGRILTAQHLLRKDYNSKLEIDDEM